MVVLVKKVVPRLRGFVVNWSQQYDSDRLLRLGVKVNTPPFCNWACPYCYSSQSSRRSVSKSQRHHKEAFDPDWGCRMKAWISQGVDLGVQAVTINGTFEPLMAPNFLDISEFCRSRGIELTVVTNGVLLDNAVIGRLYDMGAHIVTKLNVPIANTDDPLYTTYAALQKQLAGCPGPAAQVYEDRKSLLQQLMEAGFNKPSEGDGTRLGIESVITRPNLPHLPAMIAQFRHMNVYTHIEVIKMRGTAWRNRKLMPSRKEIEDLFLQVAEQDLKMGYETRQPCPPCVAGSCQENRYRLDVESDGKVFACPGINTQIGDLTTNSLTQIVKTSPELDIIRNLRNHIQGDCKNCSLFDASQCYGGCRGTAYQTLKHAGFGTLDCLVASDPSCWHVRKVLDDGTTSDIFDAMLGTVNKP